MKDLVCGVVLLATLALLPACSDDVPVQPPPPGNTQTFLPLTTRDAVLNNLEVAWDRRVSGKIDELLDDNFVFFFSPGDVGGEIPEQWLRADELAATTALLNSNNVPPAGGPVCLDVRVDLDLENVTWAVAPQGIASRGEAVYTSIVYYSFMFKMEYDLTFISSPGRRAQFTVREVVVGNGTEWRLVEWRDVENSLLAGARQNASTQESTWGSIKALYQ